MGCFLLMCITPLGLKAVVDNGRRVSRVGVDRCAGTTITEGQGEASVGEGADAEARSVLLGSSGASVMP